MCGAGKNMDSSLDYYISCKLSWMQNNIFLNFLNGWHHNCCYYLVIQCFQLINPGLFERMSNLLFSSDKSNYVRCSMSVRSKPKIRCSSLIAKSRTLTSPARVGNTVVCDYLFQQNNIWTWILRSHCSQAVNSPALCPWVVNRKHISSYSDTFFCVLELVIAAHIFNNVAEF